MLISHVKKNLKFLCSDFLSEEFINYIIKNKIKIDAITILGTLCTTSNYEEFWINVLG